MPFATSFYRDRRLIITRAWGHITLDDVRALRQALAARPEFDPTWAHVVDAREDVQFEPEGLVVSNDIPSDEIHRLAETSVFSPWARRAMVATNPATFGRFRMYGALFEDQVDASTVGVFTTLEDAIEWVTP